jgi:hypothetical protein
MLSIMRHVEHHAVADSPRGGKGSAEAMGILLEAHQMWCGFRKKGGDHLRRWQGTILGKPYFPLDQQWAQDQ